MGLGIRIGLRGRESDWVFDTSTEHPEFLIHGPRFYWVICQLGRPCCCKVADGARAGAREPRKQELRGRGDAAAEPLLSCRSRRPPWTTSAGRSPATPPAGGPQPSSSSVPYYPKHAPEARGCRQVNRTGRHLRLSDPPAAVGVRVPQGWRSRSGSRSGASRGT
jgi:hypothetical protein